VIVVVEVLLYVFLAYYVLVYGAYALLVIVGAARLRTHRLGVRHGEFQRIADSPLSMPFTVIIPAYNEELVIVNTVLAALALRYPEHEVIVVNDGSKDRTLAVLVERFGLLPSPRVPRNGIPTEAVAAVYESPDHPNLVVVDKANGKRPDAINAGSNYSRCPLLCVIDADSMLERDALLHTVRPFLRDPNVIAGGGMVRPANGLTVVDGRITGFGVPRGGLALMQAVEYLRSFQWARLGLTCLGSNLCISGAYMAVRKDVFIAMGGCAVDTITDDIEYSVRLNRYVHEHPGRERPRIAYIPDAVCYTEVPESHRVYAAQRNRWQRGTLQALLRHWRITLDPRYGLAGLFGMPYFLLAEGFSAMVEAASLLLLPFVIAFGIATPVEVLAWIGLAILLGTLLSVSAVLLQETTRVRAATTGDLVRLLGACVVESTLYRQLHLMWRVAGTFDYFVRRRTDFGLMMRYGSFQQPAGDAAAAVPPPVGAGSAGHAGGG
jgi:cellulose synthase/poly-beta-1,6-N-acetylglucosamine synthase-like glycosyltransferase